MVKWPAAKENEMKKYRVTVKLLKLEGVMASASSSSDHMVTVKVRWEGRRPKSGRGIGFMMMTRSQHGQSNYSSHKFLRRRRSSSADDGGGSSGESSSAAAVEWDGEEFERICSFEENELLSPWNVTFSVLCGKETEFRDTKLRIAGSVSLNVAELLLASGSGTAIANIVSVLPISLHVHDAVDSQALLSVSVSFAEVRNADKAPNQQAVPLPSTKDQQLTKQTTPSDSDDFSFPAQHPKRRLSFGFSWKTRHPPQPIPPPPPHPSAGNWDARELISRDGGAKLVNANVFHASFDQRSEKAAGESACAAVVAVIAHWLHSNPQSIPTKPRFDALIAEGSSEWRNLCHDESHRSSFPDNHFDLETVLKKLSHLRPPSLTISDRNSFTGIFSAEKFQTLKGATSFDEVWRHVSNGTVPGQREETAAVYIVSWNDHFFLLKADSDAYYLIDSLGERLYEGCDRAYVLKFDESTVMYEKEETAAAAREEEEWKVVCEGKECCGEYMKRFLAAVTVAELEGEEKKGEGEVSTVALLQRLQIDFHFCCLTGFGDSSGSSPAESSSSELSIFSGDEASDSRF